MRLEKEKKFDFFFILVLFLILFPFQYVYSGSSDVDNEDSKDLRIDYTKTEIDYLVRSNADLNYDEQIDLYSAYFLGVPYKSHTLVGNKNTTEKLVVNLEGMDCFTYLDYVHSLVGSKDYEDFIDKLKLTRYKGGVVSFETRNHFFYDWSLNVFLIDDVTKELFPKRATTVIKKLNKKSDGSLFLERIPVREVEISYIKPSFLTNNYLDKLAHRDYIGIYSEQEGLDVSHVGILIRKNGKLYFRQASNRSGIDSVVDIDFVKYIKDKPGIIVYRY